MPRGRAAAGVFFIAALTLLQLVPSRALLAQTSAAIVERPEDELLLLALRLEREELSEAIPAWPIRGDVLLPLGQIADLLQLAIQTNVAEGIARGYFIEEGRNFILDAKTGTVVVEGEERSFDRALVEVHQDDIYVVSRLIGEWLPIDVEVDLYGALVTIHPRELLPIQLSDQRLQRATALQRGGRGPEYPRLEVPYGWFAGPFADVHLRHVSDDSSDLSQTVLSVAAAAEILRLQTEIFLTVPSEGDAEARVTAGRRSAEADLLGPLRATEALVGNVYDPGIDLISRGSFGDGFVISNFPLYQPDQFDEHTFQGDLPPGWEVELYRNDTLIGYQRARGDGRYSFEDVPVLFGINVFRLAFYGPQGQRREEAVTFNAAQTLVSPGEMRYRLWSASPESGGDRFLGRVDYGLSDDLSVSVSGGEVELFGEARRYGKAAVFGFTDRFFAHADVAVDFSGGSAFRAGVETRLGGLGVSASHIESRSFVSEELTAVRGTLAGRTTLGLNGSLPLFGSRVPVVTDLQYDRAEEGGGTLRLNAITSTRWDAFALTNRISGFFSRVDGLPDQDSVFGSLLVSRLVSGFSLRGDLGYQVSPDFDLASVALTADRRIDRGLLVNGGLAYDHFRDEFRVILGGSKTRGQVGLNVRAVVTDGGDLGFEIDVSAGIGRLFGNRWDVDARPVSNQAAIVARAFLDRNGDGIRDPGDVPLPDVRFLVNRSTARTVTDEEGIAVLGGLTANRPTTVALAADSLEDPLLVPTRTGVEVIARPGRPVVIDFPVVITGEITGTVRLQTPADSSEAGGMTVQVLGGDGAVLRETRSAFDGFYDVTGIPPGTWTVRVDPEQAEAIGVVPEDPITFTIPPDGDILDGLDLVVRRRD